MGQRGTTNVPPVDRGATERRPLRERALWWAICTAAMLAAGVLVYRYLFAYGVSDIWASDGINQHFPALYYFRQTVGAFLANPGRGLAQWSWHLGLGADTLTSLSYYFADPFSAISLLFPLRWVEYVYEGLYFLRVLLAGLAGFAYLRSLKTREWAAVLGALVYAFSSFTFLAGLKHPFFIDAMIWFPLVLSGIERTLHRKSGWVLVAAVALAALSNFYFFFDISLIAIPYALIRYLDITPAGERLRGLMPAALRTGLPYAAGMAAAAVMLVPTLTGYLSSSRAAQSQVISFLSDRITYRSYLIGLVTPRTGANSFYGGFVVVAVALAPVLLMRWRRHKAISAMLLAFPLLLAFPFFGKLFNGLTYVGYRFEFMWGLFFGAALAVVLSEPRALSRRELAVMGVTAVVFCSLLAWAIHAAKLTLVAAAGPAALSAFVWTVLLVEHLRAARRNAVAPSAEADRLELPGTGRLGREGWVAAAMALLVFANIGGLSLGMYSKRFSPLLKSYLPLGQALPRFEHNPGMLAGSLPGGPLARVDNQVLARGSELVSSQSNDPLVQEYPGVSFWYSVMNDRITDYLMELEDRSVRQGFDYSGLDDRASLETLLGVHYYISAPDATRYVPYGFVPDGTIGGSLLYRNAHALPIGYVYHRAIDPARFATMGAVEKQQAMLTGVVVDPSVAPAVERTSPPTGVRSVPYAVEATGAVRFDAAARTLDTSKPATGITLRFAPQPGCELYVEMSDFTFRVKSANNEDESAGTLLGSIRELLEPSTGPQGSPNTSVRALVTTGGTLKDQRIQAPGATYYWGQRSLLVNTGYSASGVTTTTLRIQSPSVFRFASLRVLAVPMTGYARAIDDLAAEGMRDVTVGSDSLAGTVTSHGDGVLFLSIPYSQGWTATVDGVAAPVVPANVGFSGIALTSGTHRVELRYRTPGLAAGAAVSGIALVGLAGWAIASLLLRRREEGRHP